MLGIIANRLDDHTFEFQQSGRYLYVAKHETHRVVLELFVDDLESAKTQLLDSGWTIVDWQGRGNRCYVKDPAGVYFNVWQR